MLKARIPEKLQAFLKPKRYKVALGGRGAGKSTAYSALLSMRAHAEGVLIGCFREYQNSIEDSVHSLIKKVINDLGVPGFSIQKSYIDHESGGGFRFKGLSRSIESVKSMHGFKIFWVEEAQFLSQDSITTLLPTLRESESELWLSANPMSSSDPFSQRFIVPFQRQLDRDGFFEDELHYIVKINHDDNPWFPKALEEERQNDLRNLPRALYDHIWEGAFNDSVDDSIIPAEWFDAAVDAHIKLGFKPKGVIVVAHDPSDLGTDDKAIAKRHGSIILDARLRSFGDVNDGLDWAMDYAIVNLADLFVWDADGLGLSLKRQVREGLEGKKVAYRAFRGSEGPENPDRIFDGADGTKRPKKNRDYYKNKRAQFYGMLMDRFHKTFLAVEKGQYIDPDELISISSKIKDLPLLRNEICRIPRKYNQQGMFQVMSKVDMKRIKIKSPNLSDAVMMSLMTPDMIENETPMVFDSFFE